MKYHIHKTSLIIFIAAIVTISSFSSSVLSNDNKVLNSDKNACINNNGDYWAVLIGASGGFAYKKHEIRERNDIRDLKQVLISHGWEKDHILCLLEEEATKKAIMNTTFEWFQSNSVKEDDVILFYFSGHGHYLTEDLPPLDEPDGKDEIIATWDPDLGGWNPDKYIVDDELASKFQTLTSNNLVIIFHICNAGGMFDGDSDFGGSGQVGMASCGVNEASCMFKFQLHWMFPYYLIQGLKGRADSNDDGWISAEEALQYTVSPVAFRSKIFNLLFLNSLATQNPELFDEWPSDIDNSDELKLINLVG